MPLTVSRRAYLASNQRYRLYQGAKKIWPVCDSRYADAVLADSPFFYYRCSDFNLQNKRDSSGRGADLIASAGQTVPVVPGALRYDPDGAADFASAGSLTMGLAPYDPATMNNDGSDPGISWEFWTYQTGAPPSTHILAQRGSGTVQRQWALYTAVPGYIGIRLFGSQGGVNTALSTLDYSGRLGNSTWHYVVITYNQFTGCTVFIDNLQAGASTAYKGPLITTMLTPGLNVNMTTTSRLDELAGYNYTLTPDQMNNHYQAAWTP